MKKIRKRICAAFLTLLLLFTFGYMVYQKQEVYAAPVVAPVVEYTAYEVVETLLFLLGGAAAISVEEATTGSLQKAGEAVLDEIYNSVDLYCMANGFGKYNTTDYTMEEFTADWNEMTAGAREGVLEMNANMMQALTSWYYDIAYGGNEIQVQYGVDEYLDYCIEQAACTGSNWQTWSNSVQNLKNSGRYYALYHSIGTESISYYYYVYDYPISENPSYDHGTYWDFYGKSSSAYRYEYRYNFQTGESNLYSNVSRSFGAWKTDCIGFDLVGEDATVAVPDVIWPETNTAVDTVITNPGTYADYYDIVSPFPLTWADEAVVPVAGVNVMDDAAIMELVDEYVAACEAAESVKDVAYPVVWDLPEELPSEGEDDTQSEDIPPGGISLPFVPPETGAYMSNLKEKFPFCIPFDMVTFFKNFKTYSSEDQAPVWTFSLPIPGINYTWTFTVDMKDYWQYVKIFRFGFLALFIIGLMFSTRKLIGWQLID